MQLDTGVILSLVTAKLAKTIGAHRIRETAVTITGVGGEIYSPHEVKIALRSLQHSETIVVRANVVDSIPECLTTGQVPSIEELPEFSHLNLANPDYGMESSIDVLLDVGNYFPCLRKGIIHSQTHSISAINTHFGWVLGVGFEPDTLGSSTVYTCLTVHQNSDQLLQRYWAMEEIHGENSFLSAEDQSAVRYFEDTHFREADGYYVIAKWLHIMSNDQNFSTKLTRRDHKNITLNS